MCDSSRPNATVDCRLNVNPNQDMLPATITKGILYSLLFIVGSFGNLMVLGATTKFSALRKPCCILICNVCLCDIVLLAVGIVDFISDGVDAGSGSSALKCQILRPLSEAALLAMVITLVSIAFERFLAIMYPLRKSLHLTIRKVFAVVAVSDSVSLLFALPCFLATKYNKEPKRCTETWSKNIEVLYQSMVFLSQYLLPLPAMTLLYAVSWNCLRKRNRRTIELTTKCASLTVDNRNRQSNLFTSLTNVSGECNRFLQCDNPDLKKSASTVSLRNRKHSGASPYEQERRSSWHRLSNNRLSRSFSTALRGDADIALSVFARMRYQQSVETLRVFSCVVFMFAICMLPRQVQQLMDIREMPMNPVLNDVLSLFIYINAAANPFIYGGMSKDFRMAYKRIFNKDRGSGITNLIKASFLGPATTVALHSMTELEPKVVKRNLMSSVRTTVSHKQHGRGISSNEGLLKLLSSTLKVPIIIISRPNDEGDFPYFENEQLIDFP